MAIYDFNFNQSKSTSPISEGYTDSKKEIVAKYDRVPNQSEHKSPIAEVNSQGQNLSPEEVVQISQRGFYRLDEGMKNWLSGIKVPTTDSYKIAQSYIISHDKSVLAWAQELFDGRVQLPIVSIYRQSWSFDPGRFTPPYLPYRRVFTDRTRRKVKMSYRPIPFKVEYTTSIWASFKSDAEYIMSNIIRRCNPLGEFEVEDDVGIPIMARVKNNGNTNSADIDLDAKSKPKVIYDISMTVDYELPLNEKIVPTVLGKVLTLKERDTKEVFDVYYSGDLNGTGVRG